MIKQRNYFRSPLLRLFIPAFVLLLPVFALGGSVSQASLPVGQQPLGTEPVTVMRVYFHDNAERDRLAVELGAEEVATTQGFLTVIGDQAMYKSIIARGLRVEIDEHETQALNSFRWGDTFYSGYKSVEEMQTFLDQMVAAYPTLAQKVDIGDSWCKAHPGCTLPAPYAGYDIWALHITNQAIAGPKPVFFYDGAIHSREIARPRGSHALHQLPPGRL